MPRTIFAALLLMLAVTAEAQRQRAVRHPGTAPDLTPSEWLVLNSIPFTTTEARSGLADLEPLRRLVGNARIVSLGEATHGSRDFFTMKHRILEFLVEEMGFTIFAIEANLPEADRVNDYVLRGEGDPRKALAGMYFWTWNTAEVLDQIEWMREYNLRRGGRPPVQFRGFDAQFYPYAIAQVDAYLARVDPARSAELARSYDCMRAYPSARDYIARSAATRNACAASLDAAITTLGSRRAEYSAASSANEFERYLRYAHVVRQAEAQLSQRSVRDRHMADNVEWLADVAHPGEKLVLWAHNYHVAANALGQMGYYLRERFKKDMVVFGFAFNKGWFNARTGGTGPVDAQRTLGAPNNGWEKTFLRDAGKPRYFLDLRNLPKGQVADLLAETRTLWIIGAGWIPSALQTAHRWPIDMPSAFDVLIFIEEVKETTLLPF
ncbi:MAG TPA: erythromycin esterase family protein [Thermoanaerobaculia bacterium]|nr:erythromycin esterase family protein [Thermoanaerobaculia bacterium]